jgi:hypothetical protein
MRGRTLALLALATTTLDSTALVLTGNVDQDFTHPAVVRLTDSQGVGIPGNAPPGTLSGWDLRAVTFHLDRDAGELSVGLQCYGMAGDADGDGDPSGTSAWLAANNGTDTPGLRGTESICVGFDFDNNGTLDLIAGNRKFNDEAENLHYQNALASQPIILPFGFDPAGVPLVGAHVYNPTPETPDYEFVIRDLGEWADLLQSPLCFGVVTYCGSFLDDGIGEDLFTPDQPVCLEDAGILPTPVLSISQPLPGQMLLDWSPVPGANGYSIQEGPAATGPWSEVAQQAGTGWLRPAPGALEPMRFFRVVALD